ncbi:MAG: hypothetical protein HYT27_03175 [Parcubacteria group bacterium]|nr:hypothetical protein [Parcubacteria group bacterium]
MRKPYIGITGFMSAREVLQVLMTSTVLVNNERLVMVGVLASHKTLQKFQNKYPNLYPPVEAIADIFSNHPHALNLIHYNTKEPETLLDQMVALALFGGENMHGIQLNVKWPPHSALSEFKKRYPRMKIVLQVGNGAMLAVDNSPEKLAEKIGEYDDVAEYMLLDPSGGFGLPFDPERACEYLSALSEKKLNMTLGVAGGLSHRTLHLFDPVLQAYPHVSIDAQGKLRTENDDLDIDAACTYLSNAILMVQHRIYGEDLR